MNAFWTRLKKAVKLGRLSPSDTAAWFGVSYYTAYDWLNKVQGSRDPWGAAEQEHKLAGLERALRDAALPTNLPAKARKGAIARLAHEYNGGISPVNPAA